MICPDCGELMLGIEYAYPHHEHYDGVSEWVCKKCGVRVGRWTGRRLAEGECENRYGRDSK